MSEKYTQNEHEELSLPEGDQELLLTQGNSEEIETNEINSPPETSSFQNDMLEQSRKIINKESINKEVLSEEIEKIQTLNTEKDSSSNTLSTDNSKYLAKQNLTNIRRNLNKKDKILSGFINNAAVEKISESASKTIARPSGFLGGAILAFIGSLSYLVFVKYVGINYNYLLFFGFFIIGFLIGILLELVIKLKR